MPFWILEYTCKHLSGSSIEFERIFTLMSIKIKTASIFIKSKYIQVVLPNVFFFTSNNTNWWWRHCWDDEYSISISSRSGSHKTHRSNQHRHIQNIYQIKRVRWVCSPHCKFWTGKWMQLYTCSCLMIDVWFLSWGFLTPFEGESV